MHLVRGASRTSGELGDPERSESDLGLCNDVLFTSSFNENTRDDLSIPLIRSICSKILKGSRHNLTIQSDQERLRKSEIKDTQKCNDSKDISASFARDGRTTNVTLKRGPYPCLHILRYAHGPVQGTTGVST